MQVENEANMYGGIHGYQPKRRVDHAALSYILTDPDGKDWTAEAERNCYQPIANRRILDRVSFDFNPVLVAELERRRSPSLDEIRRYADNAIGTAYIHPILPDLKNAEKNIVIGAGVKRFRHDFGRSPNIFWPPETAMDAATARILLGWGYKAFICSPRQILRADGKEADNTPVKIGLGGGQSIVAIPFDRELTTSFGWGDLRDATRFYDQVIQPRLNRMRGLGHKVQVIAWTDAETFGLHQVFGELFMEYLLQNVLPNQGVDPKPINNLDLSGAVEGRLYDRSAWSCLCGGLKRWNEGCSCTGPDNSWKSTYYKTMEKLNNAIGAIVSTQLGRNYQELLIDQFETALFNPGPPHTNTQQSLIAAYAHSLTARTSCATFFGEPHTSGHINILFAMTAIRHLADAGLRTQASQIESEFMAGLAAMTDPTDKRQNGRNIAEQMLKG